MKTIILAVCLSILLCPLKTFAVDLCDGKNKKVYSADNLQTTLKNYEKHGVLEGDIFYVCFKKSQGFTAGLLDKSVSFTVKDLPQNADYTAATKIYISGLDLIADSQKQPQSPALTLTNPITGKTVTLANSKFEGFKDAIKIEEGEGKVELENITIAGDGTVDERTEETIKNGTGTCLSINADNAVVKSSDISKCATGILLDSASNALLGAVDKEGYLADEWNYIHNNSTGVHLVDSIAKFKFNKIDKNIIVKDNEIMASADNGILIDNGLRPVVMLDDKSGKVLSCHKKTDEGAIEKRELKFKLPSEGDVDLYLSDNNYKQGRDWIASCHAKSEETCVLQDVRLEKPLSDTECGRPDLVVTAIFTDTSSSMYTIEPFTLDGIASIIMPESAGPGDVPHDRPSDVNNVENNAGEEAGDGFVGENPFGTGSTVGVENNSPSSSGGSTATPAASVKLGCQMTNANQIAWYFILIPYLAMRILRIISNRKN